MIPRPAAALLAALAILTWPLARAGPLGLACEALTGVDYCTECSTPEGATKASCYLCHKSRASAWNSDSTVNRCKATATGAVCASSTGDTNCARCDGVYCMECKPSHQFDANFKCNPWSWATVNGCRQLSKNAQCAACTPDGACTRCSLATHILVPQNAIYINVAGQGSQCMTSAQLAAEAQAITGQALSLPAGCAEVDTEFKCNRCQDGQSLTNGACVPEATGSKCKATLPYRQYCAACDATGLKCLSCNGSRSPQTTVADGRCALPCKQLYGIGCLACNQATCTAQDSKYAQGRR